MADFIFDETGISSLIRQLEKADLYDDESTKDLLFAGAEILVRAIKAEIKKAGHVRTRSMIDNIVFTKKVKTDKKGVKSVTISPRGKDRYGSVNAQKAFVLNYGRAQKGKNGKPRGKIDGSHFWNKARAKAQPEINRRCEEIATEKLKQRGLI